MRALAVQESWTGCGLSLERRACLLLRGESMMQRGFRSGCARTERGVNDLKKRLAGRGV